MQEKRWYFIHHEEVSKILDTHIEKGLSTDEAEKRLEKFGYNELIGKKGPTIFEMLLSQFKDFLVLILIAASIISVFMGEITDSIVIILIVVLNAIIGVIQEYKAGKAMEALKKMAAPEARVIRDGSIKTVPSRELVPGDIVLLEAGNYVPADLRLVESLNLKIDEAALTGESVPVEKNANIVFNKEIPLGDRKNTAFMGTVVTYGRGKGVVVSTGIHTEIGMIAKMLESYDEEETPLQKKLQELGKVLGIVSLLICGFVFLIGVYRGIPLLEMFMTSVSLAVAAIPEGLPAIVTIVLALGMQRMVKRNALVKKLHAVETLGSTTVICSDKTGTLTQNQMTAVKAFTSGKLYNITGEGYKPIGDFILNGEKIDPSKDSSLSLLLKIGALCNDSSLEESGFEHGNEKTYRIVGDPTEGALVVAACKANFTKNDLETLMPRIGEIPFDSDRKRMTTFHNTPEGIIAFTKGAPDIILDLSTKIYRDGKVQPMSLNDREEILRINEELSSNALRVLAFAYRPFDKLPEDTSFENIETELVFVGLIGMIDPPRPESIEAIKKCKKAGIKPVMITGDYKNTAVAIARELGLIESNSRVITGAELDNLSEEELASLSKDINVYARVSPIHKLKIVEAIKKNNHIVAMTGDGVNDAPALKMADIGIAMGITGTDVAKETADMILTDDNFASIVSAVEEGRTIYSNIRKFIFFLLSCNIAEILIIFTAMLIGMPVPLKPIQLLWLNLLTDAFPALALGMEKKEDYIMEIPPRKPEEPIMDKKMKIQIAVQSIFMTISILGVFYFALNSNFSIEKARTYAFATLIFGELLRAFTSRSETESIFKLGFFTNSFMLLGTSLSFLLLLAVLYIPSLNKIFDTVFLSAKDWIYIIVFGLIPFASAEISKVFLRKRY